MNRPIRQRVAVAILLLLLVLANYSFAANQPAGEKSAYTGSVVFAAMRVFHRKTISQARDLTKKRLKE